MARTVLAAAVLLLAACGNQTTVPDTGPETTGPVDPYGDPPDYAGDPFRGFGEVFTLEVPGEAPVAEEVPEVPEIPEMVTGGNVAVQISAALEEESALHLVDLVQAQVDAPVFVDHIGEYWKVRVGAFASREDAEDLLHRLQEMGYTDAWIVEREP
jgi:hypothetical protein